MVKQTVVVTTEVDVSIDESKFTEEWMAEFRQHFYSFTTVQDHIEHLAQLYARGVIDGFENEFVEGYGPLKEMGISFTDGPIETQIVVPYTRQPGTI
jgi:hypothetical protein